MINKKNFLYGAVFSRLIENPDKTVAIRKYKKDSRSSFLINEKIGIYIKTSEKRGSPRTFTFMKEHQEEIQELRDKFENIFLILVCNDDGIVCLSFEELKHILDYKHDSIERIRVQRKKGEKYTVYGSDGVMPKKIGDNEFPKKIIG